MEKKVVRLGERGKKNTIRISTIALLCSYHYLCFRPFHLFQFTLKEICLKFWIFLLNIVVLRTMYFQAKMIS